MSCNLDGVSRSTCSGEKDEAASDTELNDRPREPGEKAGVQERGSNGGDAREGGGGGNMDAPPRKLVSRASTSVVASLQRTTVADGGNDTKLAGSALQSESAKKVCLITACM